MRSNHRYGIIANPASGSLSADNRLRLLKEAASELNAEIYGLDTKSAEELAQCARQVIQRCDVLVVAGGDGTMSLVINAVDLKTTVLAFIPFGTGNALTHSLAYRGGPRAIANRIRNGAAHECDLIDCGGIKKAFMTSLGLDGEAIRQYEVYRRKGYRGLKAHARALFHAFFRSYRPTGCHIKIDENGFRVRRMTSCMVVKQPFFGMGLKTVPLARWDDGFLHSVVITSGLPGIAAGLLTGFTIGNRTGKYEKGKRISATTEIPQVLQIDGDMGWTGCRFDFSVLPGALRLRH